MMTNKVYLGISLTTALAVTVVFHSVIGYVLQNL